MSSLRVVSSNAQPLLSHDSKVHPGLSRWQCLPDNGFVPGLEGLRGLGIISVIVAHWSSGPYPLMDPLGHIGVTIFFVLSGYNTMGSIMRAQRSSHELPNAISGKSRKPLRSVWLDRQTKLIPPIVLVVTCLTAYAWWRGPASLPVYGHYGVLALTHTANVMPLWQGRNPGPFSNLWSNGVMEQFNAFLLLIGPHALRLGIRRRIQIFSAVIGISYCLRFYSGSWPASFLGSICNWHFNAFANAWRFAIGSALRCLPVPAVLISARSSYLGLALGCLTVWLMLQPGAPLYLGSTPGATRDLFEGFGTWVEPMTAFATCLIICGCRARSPTSSSSTLGNDEHVETRSGNLLLESQPLQFFGNISYAWYLWQSPVMIATGWRRGWMGTQAQTIAFVGGYLSTHHFEGSARQWCRRRLRQMGWL